MRFVLEQDIDGAFVAVPRPAPEDQIAHGFLQPRREKGFLAVFQGIVVQGGLQSCGQKAFQEASHDGAVPEIGSGQQVVGRVELSEFVHVLQNRRELTGTQGAITKNRRV